MTSAVSAGGAEPERAADAPQIPFYARKIIDEATLLAEAAELMGVDEELILLRGRLHTHLRVHGEDLELMLRLSSQIVRAVEVRYRLSPQTARDVQATVSAELAALHKTLGGALDDPQMPQMDADGSREDGGTGESTDGADGHR